MCGRYSLTSFVQMHGFKPRFNVAPSQYAPIVTENGAVEMIGWRDLKKAQVKIK